MSTLLWTIWFLVICTSTATSYVIRPVLVRHTLLSSSWKRRDPPTSRPNHGEWSDSRRNGWLSSTPPHSVRLFMVDPTNDSQNIPFFGSTNSVNGAVGEEEKMAYPSSLKSSSNTPNAAPPSIPTPKKTAYRTTPVNDPVLSMTDSVMEVFSSFGKLFQNMLHTVKQETSDSPTTAELSATVHTPEESQQRVAFVEEETATVEEIHTLDVAPSPLQSSTDVETVVDSTTIVDAEDDVVVVELDAEELDRWNAKVEAVVRLDATVTTEDVVPDESINSVDVKEENDDVVTVERDAAELDRWNEQNGSVALLDATSITEDSPVETMDPFDVELTEEMTDPVIVKENEDIVLAELESMEVDATVNAEVDQDEDSMAAELDKHELDQSSEPTNGVVGSDATSTEAGVDEEIMDSLSANEEDDIVMVELDTAELDRWNEQKDSVLQLDAIVTTKLSEDITQTDPLESFGSDQQLADTAVASDADKDLLTNDMSPLTMNVLTNDLISTNDGLDVSTPTTNAESIDGSVAQALSNTREVESPDIISSITSDVVETDIATDKATSQVALDDEGEFSMDDLEASIQLAQQSMDGTIVGLSMNLYGDDTQKKDDSTLLIEVEEDSSSIDPEQLAIAARLAVEAFERKQEEEKQSIQRQRDMWSTKQVSLDDLGRQKTSSGIKAKKKADKVTKWNDMTVNQLKAELETRGLPKTGTKAKLIARLDENEEHTPTPNIDAFTKSGSIASDEVSPAALKDWSSLRVTDLRSELLTRGLPTTGKKGDLVLALEQSDRERQLKSASAVDSVASIDFSRIAEELVEDATRVENAEAAIPEDDAFQDMEALARAAREAVALFEKSNTKVAPLLDDELEVGDVSFETDEAIMDGLFDDDIDIDIEDLDLDALEKTTREVVLRLEPDDDEPSDEALWEIENEISLHDDSILDGESMDHGLLTEAMDEDKSPLPMETPPNYASLAVSQLKEELNRRGLRVTGKKVDLIARLEASDKGL
jgi:SAP domain